MQYSHSLKGYNYTTDNHLPSVHQIHHNLYEANVCSEELLV